MVASPSPCSPSAETPSVRPSAGGFLPPGWLLLIWVLLTLPLLAGVSADADLFWHILAGQRILAERAIPMIDDWSYTASGHPWINHEWLSQIVMAGIWEAFGNRGLLALRALVLLGAAFFLGLALWKRCPDPFWATLLFCLPLWVYSELINLRPLGVTTMGVTLVLLLLTIARTGARWPLWALGGCFLVWCNLHAGFMFGLGISGIAILLMVRSGIQPPGAVLCLLIYPLVTIVLNPFGISLWEYIFREVGSPHPHLPEWNPPEPALAVVAMVFFLLPIVLAIWRRTSALPEEWLGLLISHAMTMQSARFIVLEIMFALLAIASGLGRRPPAHPFLTCPRRALINLAALGAIFGTFHLGLMKPPGRIPIDPRRYPVGGIAYLRAAAGPSKLWLPLGWGGYAIFHLSQRGVKVAIDGRNTTVYPVDFVVAHSHLLVDGKAEPIRQVDPDVLMGYASGPLYDTFTTWSDYEQVYRDDLCAIFVRRGFPWNHPSVIPSGITEFPG